MSLSPGSVGRKRPLPITNHLPTPLPASPIRWGDVRLIERGWIRHRRRANEVGLRRREIRPEAGRWRDKPSNLERSSSGHATRRYPRQNCASRRWVQPGWPCGSTASPTFERHGRLPPRLLSCKGSLSNCSITWLERPHSDPQSPAAPENGGRCFDRDRAGEETPTPANERRLTTNKFHPNFAGLPWEKAFLSIVPRYLQPSRAQKDLEYPTRR